MYEYKVITQRDKRFSGSFDPADLEAALNTYAADGWRLVDATLAASLWKTSKVEFVMILERPRPPVSPRPNAPS